jgi:hypothetical protein
MGFSRSLLTSLDAVAEVQTERAEVLNMAPLVSIAPPHGISYSFEPPSTGVLAPVIQRDLSEAKGDYI